jgi:type III secretion protein V
VRIRESAKLLEKGYRIVLNGAGVASGTVPSDGDPYDYMVGCVEAAVRLHFAEFFGIDEAIELVTEVGLLDLRESLLRDESARSRFVAILRGLLREGVSLTNPSLLLEIDRANVRSAEEAVEVVRAALGSRASTVTSGRTLTVPRAFEDRVRASLRDTEDGRFLAISMEEAVRLREDVETWIGSADSDVTVVVRDPAVRPYVRKVVAIDYPDVSVVSRRDLSRAARVELIANMRERPV